MRGSRPDPPGRRTEPALLASRRACLSSKASEMYLRKIRPRTTCLYSAASIEPRRASAMRHSSASSPVVAPWAVAAPSPSAFCVLGRPRAMTLVYSAPIARTDGAPSTLYPALPSPQNSSGPGAAAPPGSRASSGCGLIAPGWPAAEQVPLLGYWRQPPATSATSTTSAVAWGGGTGSPSSHIPSMWNSIASRISSSNSSLVLAVATQPGRSGTYAA